MKKDKYYIGISGEDSTFCLRELTKKEADLVGKIIDELETNREGCWMEKLPSDKEIQNILNDYQEWRKKYNNKEFLKYNQITFEDQLFRRYMYDILSQQKKMGYEVQGYVFSQISKVIDMYKKL